MADVPVLDPENPTLLRRAADIELLVLDVDGVLTDGRLYIDAAGRETKTFHVRDGQGIKALMAGGVVVAAISGRQSAAAAARFGELGVEHYFLGHENKRAAWDELLTRLSITSAERVACIGDDTPDLELMQQAGLAFAVADAHSSTLAGAHWQTRNPGGYGAVREVCDLLLRARREASR